MEKHTVIDLMPVLKKRKCNRFDSCNLMVYGPWTKVGEASMEKGSPLKIRPDGRKQNKLNVGVKKSPIMTMERRGMRKKQRAVKK